MITRDLRRVLAGAVTAAGFPAPADPGLRPTGTPGQYAASVALALGADPRETAASIAASLRAARWIAAAEVTGPGYLTVTVAEAALAAVADAITAAGPDCVTSDALVGLTVTAAPPGDPLAAATWEETRAALAAQLTARLAAAAGATVEEGSSPERQRPTPDTAPAQSEARYMSGAPRLDIYRNFMNSEGGAGVTGPRSEGSKTAADAEARRQATEAEVAAAVSFAGRDAVTFALARAVPGRPVRIDPEIIARRVVGNPAYAVRYAHARAASGVRWAVPPRERTAPSCPPADPGELALLDALSWLPERVATAARRARPDEFARYLEDLASVTVDVLSSPSRQGSAAPGSDRLSLACAARTGLAAGLELLGVSAPERF